MAGFTPLGEFFGALMLSTMSVWFYFRVLRKTKLEDVRPSTKIICIFVTLAFILLV